MRKASINLSILGLVLAGSSMLGARRQTVSSSPTPPSSTIAATRAATLPSPPPPHASPLLPPPNQNNVSRDEVHEPDLYQAAEAYEWKKASKAWANSENAADDGTMAWYWPSWYVMTEEGQTRYAVVGTTTYGSGKNVMLLSQQEPGQWRVLGQYERMGENPPPEISPEEKRQIGAHRLPPGVWQRLLEIEPSSFSNLAI